MLEDLATIPFANEENRATAIEWFNSTGVIPSNDFDRGDLWYHSMHRLYDAIKDPAVGMYVGKPFLKYLNANAGRSFLPAGSSGEQNSRVIG